VYLHWGHPVTSVLHTACSIISLAVEYLKNYCKFDGQPDLLQEEGDNMTTTKLGERYSFEDAQAIIAKFEEYSFDDFHGLFSEGKTPSFDEIEGDTAGSFLTLNPEAGLWRKLALAATFDNPLARWTGKRFITQFEKEKTGRGINLFRNRIFTQRFGVNTSIDDSLFDLKPCLVVTYPHFPSSVFGLRDELRRIDDGVFLGQGHHRLPWGKGYSLQGYFILCALNRSG